MSLAAKLAYEDPVLIMYVGERRRGGGKERREGEEEGRRGGGKERREGEWEEGRPPRPSRYVFGFQISI